MNKYYITFGANNVHRKFGMEISAIHAIEINAENKEDAEKRARVHFGSGFRDISNSIPTDQAYTLIALSDLIGKEPIKKEEVKEEVKKEEVSIKETNTTDTKIDPNESKVIPKTETMQEKLARLKRERSK